MQSLYKSGYDVSRWIEAAAAATSRRSGTLANACMNQMRTANHSTSEIDTIPWFHTIDLGKGRLTSGVKSRDQLALESSWIPERLDGKSVLDIGAWDGYFSFLAEARGARKVVALDHYAWSTDHTQYRLYHAAATNAGEAVRPPDEVESAWDPTGLPGRVGFDIARRALRSRVKPVVSDFMAMDLHALGQFDVVFFLGVLYHLKDPFLALRRLRQVTRELAIIESAAVVWPGWTADKLWLFLETDELNSDAGNWWEPTAAGLVAACRAAGFREATLMLEPPKPSPTTGESPIHYRVAVHANV
jgi:tRNA (mo5U34)-methyltransferase